jgi:SPP1 family predicted phage head-tail adaptor
VIGKKTKLELRRATEASDGMGGWTVSWEGVRKIKGALVSVSGDERFNQDKSTVIQTHNFFVKNPIGETITEKDKFVSGLVSYDILYVESLGAKENQLKIALKEIS